MRLIIAILFLAVGLNAQVIPPYYLKSDTVAGLTLLIGADSVAYWAHPDSLGISGGGGGTPAGANTQVQFNNSGAFGADADFTFSADYLAVPRLTLSDSLWFGAFQRANLTGTSLEWNLLSASSVHNWKDSGGSNILQVREDGDVRFYGGILDLSNSLGTSNQVLVSTGSQIQWQDQEVSNAGTGDTNRIAIWTDANTIRGDSGLYYDNNTLTVGGNGPKLLHLYEPGQASVTMEITQNSDTWIVTQDGDLTIGKSLDDRVTFKDASGTRFDDHVEFDHQVWDINGTAPNDKLILFGDTASTGRVLWRYWHDGNAGIKIEDDGTNSLDLNGSSTGVDITDLNTEVASWGDYTFSFASSNVTVPVNGLYKVTVNLSLYAASFEGMHFTIRANGTEVSDAEHTIDLPAATNSHISFTETISLSANDVVDIFADGDGSGTVNLINNGCTWEIELVSR